MNRHICSKQSPMRANSDPDDWHHPDATIDLGSAWWTFDNPDLMIEIECVFYTCPHCGHSSTVRTGKQRPREIMP